MPIPPEITKKDVLSDNKQLAGVCSYSIIRQTEQIPLYQFIEGLSCSFSNLFPHKNRSKIFRTRKGMFRKDKLFDIVSYNAIPYD